MNPEQVFLCQLPFLEELAGFACRRNGIFGPDAEDFASEVKLKLVEDEYAVLRRFRGDSSLRTYLNVVVQNYMRDFQTKRWGKWKLSAKAKRLGERACLLETLTVRDGHSLKEAIEILLSDYGVTATRADLLALASELPQRVRRKMEGEEALEQLCANPTDDPARRSERLETATRIRQALGRARSTISDEDWLVLKMRYRDGYSVPTIARILDRPQRALYGVTDRCIRRLRASFSREGLQWNEVVEILEWEDPNDSLGFNLLDDDRETHDHRPSKNLEESNRRIDNDSSRKSPLP